MYQYAKQLIIAQSAKIFFNNQTIRAVRKVLINKLRIGIGRIIYMQKIRYIYNYTRNVNAIIYFNLKRYYIKSKQLFYSKKQILILFIYLLIKAINFQLLHIMIFFIRLKLNLYAFFFASSCKFSLKEYYLSI